MKTFLKIFLQVFLFCFGFWAAQFIGTTTRTVETIGVIKDFKEEMFWTPRFWSLRHISTVKINCADLNIKEVTSKELKTYKKFKNLGIGTPVRIRVCIVERGDHIVRTSFICLD